MDDMTDSTAQQGSHWPELLAEDDVKTDHRKSKDVAMKDTAAVPTELKVRLTHGVWFGTAMGIGFAIGFLISFLALAGFVGFVIFSRFPGLFS